MCYSGFYVEGSAGVWTEVSDSSLTASLHPQHEQNTDIQMQFWTIKAEF